MDNQKNNAPGKDAHRIDERVEQQDACDNTTDRHCFDEHLMDQIDGFFEQRKDVLTSTVTVKRLAEHLKTTQKSIYQLFRLHNTYANFNDYLNRKRVAYACQLLCEHSGFTIEGIAQESGFSSSSTFYRWFVKETGMKPTEYRNAAK